MAHLGGLQLSGYYPMKLLIVSIQQFFSEFRKTSVGVDLDDGTQVSISGRGQGEENRIVWVCLPAQWLALSCDEAWDAAESRGDILWVLQDHKGAIIAASGKIVQGHLDVLFVEVCGLYYGSR